jgi:LacI family transcriptional regulator
LLLLGTQIAEDHLAEVADLGRPCVVLNREHPALPCVVADRRQGTRLAAEHLLAHGRRRLGLLGAAYRGGAPVAVRPELAGFRDACAAHGVTPDDSLIRFAPTGSAADPAAPAEAAATALIDRLLDGDSGDPGRPAGTRPVANGAPRPAPDAGLVVFTYTLAPGAGRAIGRSGVRVPDQLALVLGDADAEARETLDLPATTVEAPKFAMAQAAARLLLRLVRREAVPASDCRQVFPMELRVRWSCGARGAYRPAPGSPEHAPGGMQDAASSA